MASLKSSQGVAVVLVALLVCQAFMVPALARTQAGVETKKVAEPQDMVNTEGHDGHGHGHHGHRHGDHGHGVETKKVAEPQDTVSTEGHDGHGHHGHRHGDHGHDNGGHKGGHH